MKATNKKDKYEKIMEKKLSTPIEVELNKFRYYVRDFRLNLLLIYLILEDWNLKRNQNIHIAGNIFYDRKLFKNLFDKSGYENDN